MRAEINNEGISIRADTFLHLALDKNQEPDLHQSGISIPALPSGKMVCSTAPKMLLVAQRSAAAEVLYI